MTMFTAKNSGLTRMNLCRTTPKQIFMEEKLLLCIWWDHHGIHFKFLNCNQTLSADLYFQQLQHVNENLQRKHPALVNQRNVQNNSKYSTN